MSSRLTFPWNTCTMLMHPVSTTIAKDGISANSIWTFPQLDIPKALYCHIQKVFKNIVENMLQKICYLATVMSNLSFLEP